METAVTVKMQIEKVVKLDEFKYPVNHSKQQCTRKVKKSVQAGWSRWNRGSVVICGRRKVVKEKMVVGYAEG